MGHGDQLRSATTRIKGWQRSAVPRRGGPGGPGGPADHFASAIRRSAIPLRGLIPRRKNDCSLHREGFHFGDVLGMLSFGPVPESVGTDWLSSCSFLSMQHLTPLAGHVVSFTWSQAFRQNVCGFDILRTANGSFVPWQMGSFVTQPFEPFVG